MHVHSAKKDCFTASGWHKLSCAAALYHVGGYGGGEACFLSHELTGWLLVSSRDPSLSIPYLQVSALQTQVLMLSSLQTEYPPSPQALFHRELLMTIIFLSLFFKLFKHFPGNDGTFLWLITSKWELWLIKLFFLKNKKLFELPNTK